MTTPPREEMVRAFLGSDAAYDGLFYTAVKTTGIFCRPACPARKPLPQNVEFFATVREAMFAGYRPCKRCTPLDAPGRPPEWVAGLIERVERRPEEKVRAAELRAMGIDPGRARRWFKVHYGMTFGAFGRARRLSGALEAIRKGGTVDDAVFESGYESHSGFRDAFARVFGTTPGQSESVDAISLSWIESPIGPLIAGADDRGVCLLEFSDRRMLEAQLQTLRKRLGRTLVPGTHPHLEQLRTELAEYFDRKRVMYVGHSQGATTGPLFLGVAHNVLGGVISAGGGHLLVTSNAVFYVMDLFFGAHPEPYYWLALLTHLLNVGLFFAVVRLFTQSPYVACFGATLWGIAPLNEAAIGWYSVFGQVLVATVDVPHAGLP
jgi:AraC family transcriptional regulator of adaptative response/methylated-DNA-[protein]-cysteine methyltransferase